MRKPDIYLKEYVQRLSDDSLRFLLSKLDQRLNGDVAEAVDFLGKTREFDKWLSSAESHNEFYDMIDLVQSFLKKEFEARF